MNIVREITDCVELKNSLDTNGNHLGMQLKAIMKTWRNRTPALSDEMSLISQWYNWRCQIYTMISKKIEETEQVDVSVSSGVIKFVKFQPNLLHSASSHAILPFHSAAQGQVCVARAAKSMGLYDLATDQLHRFVSSRDGQVYEHTLRLNTMVTLPLMDAHNKVVEHLKVIRSEADHPFTEPRRREMLLLSVGNVDKFLP